jgi:hypothetical protein
MGDSHLTPRPEPEKLCQFHYVFACRGERVHADFVASGTFIGHPQRNISGPRHGSYANPKSPVIPLEAEGDSVLFFGLGTAAYWGPVRGVRSNIACSTHSIAGL